MTRPAMPEAMRLDELSNRGLDGYPLGGRANVGANDAWFPLRDGESAGGRGIHLSRNSVKFGSHARVEAKSADPRVSDALTNPATYADRAAVEWPPLEQDDTSDELHESPWWTALDDGVDWEAVPRSFGADAGARWCIDVRDRVPGRADDAVVVREALGEAVSAGLISPVEPAELWPTARPDSAAAAASTGPVDTHIAVDFDDVADGW
jgi:hypothetical protein